MSADIVQLRPSRQRSTRGPGDDLAAVGRRLREIGESIRALKAARRSTFLLYQQLLDDLYQSRDGQRQ